MRADYATLRRPSSSNAGLLCRVQGCGHHAQVSRNSSHGIAAHVHLSQNQVHLSQDQVHLSQNQVHLSQNQVHLSQNQVHLSQDDSTAPPTGR